MQYLNTGQQNLIRKCSSTRHMFVILTPEHVNLFTGKTHDVIYQSFKNSPTQYLKLKENMKLNVCIYK